MELLVASWTVRIALLAALVVGGLTFQSGYGVPEAVLRAAFAAAVLTTLGRVAVGLLETPEQRLLRLRAKRTRDLGRRPQPGTGAGAGRPDREPGREAT